MWKGTIVGVYGRDAFVELGPRMQGVIDVKAFETKPSVGDVFEFTLRGQEEGLWALQLAQQKALVTWEQMEVGSVVQAHVVRVAHGGLEVKLGPLHAFLPKSHTGLERTDDVQVLVGKNFACEVIEVDAQRQRVVVSRKLVLQRERTSEHQRLVGAVKPGDVVQGRVTRIEPYGVFVAFGKGLTGLVHVSNLAHERVEDAASVVQLGQILDLRVLHIKQGGKRIGLGLKQMQQSPWSFVESAMYAGQIVTGRVTRLVEFGAFVAVRDGVEGLLPLAHAGLAPGQALRAVVAPGATVSVRVLDLDPEHERMSLSLLHEDGRRILADEAENLLSFRELARGDGEHGLATRLGDKLKRVLGDDADREKRAS
ncbi:MAG: 30S ribosomal protein S1 [Planctomycetes bacterium]|nr:30S ribosomal protein S1 [Planctomycetota bacterium]